MIFNACSYLLDPFRHVSWHASGEIRLQFAQEHEEIRRWVVGRACHLSILRVDGARYFQEMSEEKKDWAECATRSVEAWRAQS